MKFLLFAILFFVALAQAQLVPEGMVLNSDTTESTVTPVLEAAPEPERITLREYEPVKDDSITYYDVKIHQYSQAYNHDMAVSRVLKFISIGTTLVGAGLFVSSYGMDDQDYEHTSRGIGTGFLVGSLVSLGFSVGFDIKASGNHVHFQYYNQKKIDYLKRHSILRDSDL